MSNINIVVAVAVLALIAAGVAYMFWRARKRDNSMFTNPDAVSPPTKLPTDD